MAGEAVQVVRMRRGDEAKVAAAAEAFDHPVDLAATRRFLRDDRHHLLVAYVEHVPAGFVSATELLHPDKPRPEMFLNELGVIEAFRRRGVATALVAELIELSMSGDCSELWVLTDESNEAAKATYANVGATRAPDEKIVMFTVKLHPNAELTGRRGPLA